MQSPESKQPRGPFYGTRLPTTHWTVVLQAGEQMPAALEALCTLYCNPLRAWVMASGYSEPDAEDAVQDFLLRVQEPGFLANVAPEKGRFRSWLLKSLKHQLASAWARDRAAKRGGGVRPAALDTVSGEHAPGNAVADGRRSPDAEYEHRWAQTVLANAWERLRAELATQGRRDVLEVLEPALYRDGDRAPYRQIAGALGLSETGVRSAAQRLRERLRQVIREEVARTVPDPDENPAEVEAELKHLIQVLTR